MGDERSDAVRVEDGKIHFSCFTCGQKIRAPVENAGDTGTCPSCKKAFVTPLLRKDEEAVPTFGVEASEGSTSLSPDQSFFLVKGTDSKTTTERTIRVVAGDVQQALEIARGQGIFPRTAVRDKAAKDEQRQVAEAREQLGQECSELKRKYAVALQRRNNELDEEGSRKSLEFESSVGTIPCPDCKKEVSRVAQACPHCGRSFAVRNYVDVDTSGYSVAGVLLTILAVAGWIWVATFETTIKDVHNIGLLNDRLLLAIAASAIQICGAIFLLIGCLGHALEKILNR